MCALSGSGSSFGPRPLLFASVSPVSAPVGFQAKPKSCHTSFGGRKSLTAEKKRPSSKMATNKSCAYICTDLFMVCVLSPDFVVGLICPPLL